MEIQEVQGGVSLTLQRRTHVMVLLNEMGSFRSKSMVKMRQLGALALILSPLCQCFLNKYREIISHCLIAAIVLVMQLGFTAVVTIAAGICLLGMLSYGSHARAVG